jgi:hypothetical protein
MYAASTAAAKRACDAAGRGCATGAGAGLVLLLSLVL